MRKRVGSAALPAKASRHCATGEQHHDQKRKSAVLGLRRYTDLRTICCHRADSLVTRCANFYYSWFAHVKVMVDSASALVVVGNIETQTASLIEGGENQ